MPLITSQELRKCVESMNMKMYFENELAIEKCVSLCNRFTISPNVLLERMEAFLINNSLQKLGLNSIGRFESNLLEISQKKVLAPEPTTSTGKRPLPMINTLATKVPKLEAAGGEPTNKLEASFSQTSGISFTQRTSAGQVVQSYNPELKLKTELSSDLYDATTRSNKSKCKITAQEDDFENIGVRFRYMFTTLEERAKSLEKHLLALQKDMCQALNLDESILAPVGVPSPDVVWNCGRIYCESAEGRINATSVVLEGSRRDSYGRRIRLDLKELPSYSLFPGQIVLIEGINPSGRHMIVKRVIEGVSKPSLMSSPKLLHEYHHSTYYQNHQPLSIMVATGPFTTSDNLFYQPLGALLSVALQKRPDVLVLIGPFVDITQPLLSTADIKLLPEDDDENNKEHEATYEVVFREKVIRDNLMAFFNSEEEGQGHTQIILIPSLQDAHHDYVFPQPPFGNREELKTSFFEESLGVYNIPYSAPSDPKKRVHLISNPCMFRINEILFGICATDILFGLSSDEISKDIEGNRITKLSSHLLQQQSFCPQFPVPTNTIAQLDLRHARHWEFKKKPDVLILPSRLAPFVKDISNSIVMNPGTLTKGINGGTYAMMTIHPYQENILLDLQKQSMESHPHNLPPRTAVEIVKI